jgi:hypothetical protein
MMNGPIEYQQIIDRQFNKSLRCLKALRKVNMALRLTASVSASASAMTGGACLGV